MITIFETAFELQDFCDRRGWISVESPDQRFVHCNESSAERQRGRLLAGEAIQCERQELWSRHNLHSRNALVCTFLALLELVRLQAILLRQDRVFSDIIIKKHENFDQIMTEQLAMRDDWK